MSAKLPQQPSQNHAVLYSVYDTFILPKNATVVLSYLEDLSKAIESRRKKVFFSNPSYTIQKMCTIWIRLWTPFGFGPATSQPASRLPLNDIMGLPRLLRESCRHATAVYYSRRRFPFNWNHSENRISSAHTTVIYLRSEWRDVVLACHNFTRLKFYPVLLVQRE